MLQMAVLFIVMVPCTLLFVVQAWMLALYFLVSYVGLTNAASLGTDYEFGMTGRHHSKAVTCQESALYRA
jgi:hypothetical protein